jgi:putative PIG3 family NAD(P)H quinone oxidoreductase
MKAIVFDEPGEADVLHLAEIDDPVPGSHELLVRVHASALNRADVLQRRGFYAPGPGASSILGLELAGEVLAIGPGVGGFKPGDRIYGLSGGGGYGELATIHESLALPVPQGWDYQYAAAITEVFYTANEALRTLGRLEPGERALIHAGGSGVGIAAIQIGKTVGAEVFVTAGTDAKCDRARQLGADVVVNYKRQDFAEVVKERTEGRGVDVILDVLGASYWESNLASLSVAGRLILVGLMGGTKVEANLGLILAKRLQVIGTAMRSQPLENRAAITQRYREWVEPRLIDETFRPIIDRVFPLRAAADAHRHMEANQNFGKIVLAVADGA